MAKRVAQALAGAAAVFVGFALTGAISQIILVPC
jgi:hypothetical protein